MHALRARRDQVVIRIAAQPLPQFASAALGTPPWLLPLAMIGEIVAASTQKMMAAERQVQLARPTTAVGT
jgi:hypothetical protein